MAHEVPVYHPDASAPIEHQSTIRFGAAARRFLEHCRVGKRLSPHTLRAYKHDLHDFASLNAASLPVAVVDRERMRGYARSLLEDRELKESTVRRRFATLKTFFRWLELEDLIAVSVFHRLDLSIRLPRRLPRALDSSEVRRILARTEADTACYDGLLMHLVVVVLLTTGLRIGELVATKIGDLSFSDASWRVRGKGNRERRVYLAGRLAQATLQRYLTARRRIAAPTDGLLVTAAGAQVTESYVRRRLRVIAGDANIGKRVTPHMFRHTAATQLLEAGVDIRFVQRLLGHSSIATTQLYTEVRDAALRDHITRADVLSRIRSARR